MHLIPSHQGRPSDDPDLRPQQGGDRAPQERRVNRQRDGRGACSTTRASWPSCPRRPARCTRSPAPEWAAYAPIAGTPEFQKAVLADLFGGEPELAPERHRQRHPGRIGRAAPRPRELPRARAVAADHQLVLGALPDALRRGRSQARVLRDVRFQGGARRGRVRRGPRQAARAADARARVHQRPVQQPHRLLDDRRRVARGGRAHRRALERGARHAARRLRVLPLRRARSAGVPAAPAAPGRQGQANVLFAWSASKSFTHYGLRVGALVACVADKSRAGLHRRGAQLLVARLVVQLQPRRPVGHHAPARRPRDGRGPATPSATASRPCCAPGSTPSTATPASEASGTRATRGASS